MDAASNALLSRSLALSADLLARAEADTKNATSDSTEPQKTTRPPIYKTIGIILAICSGLFIGVSFVVKKVGLLKANAKYNEEAGEGYGYLKNAWWWTGMILMIIGEICNFVAYSFTDAILVTPLGALSVVVTTVLSAIFLKERLSFVGKVGCFICIIGSVVIVLSAPEQSAVSNIQEMQHYVIAPGFLAYAGVILVGCAAVAWFVAPKYGKKSMLVYLTICSLIGGLSVVATQGLGAAVLAAIGGEAQFNKWFTYVLFVFVIATLLTEIIYLNKALNLFNAALVTPTYYVYFTSSTIIASAILFRGFHGTVVQIVNVVMGFLVICSGVILLQLAKSSKDVPDSAVLKGDLDEIRTVAEQEEPEYEPRADAIRGGAGIVRAMSKIRTQRQVDEVKRIQEERMMPINEGETFEWDGLRRRKTVSTVASGSLKRRKTVHPPLGMTKFPDEDDDDRISNPDSEVHPGFFGRIGRKSRREANQTDRSGISPVPLRNISPDKVDPEEQHRYVPTSPLHMGNDGEMDTSYPGAAGGGGHIHFAGSPPRDRTASQASSSLAPPRPPPHSVHASTTAGPAKRQFSFQNVFGRRQRGDSTDSRPVSRGALSFVSRNSSRGHEYPNQNRATEEERLGLVHGDSARALPRYEEVAEEREGSMERVRSGSSDDWQVTSGNSSSPEQLGLSGDLDGVRRGRDPYAAPGTRGSEDEDNDDSGVLYDEPLQSPPERGLGYQLGGGGSGQSGGSGRPAFM